VVSIPARISSTWQERASARRQHEDIAMTSMTNESPLDRIIRIVFGIGLVGLALAGSVTAPILYIVWAVAVIALVTGIVGFCPLYALFRISSKRGAH
jgi:hypothetical protein